MNRFHTLFLFLAMRKNLFVVILFLLPFLLNAQQKENLRKDVYVLSSDSLEGRKVGTIGGEKAREYICSQLRDVSLEYTTQICHEGLGKNIIVEINAENPKFKDEYILLGAHYDHLGVRNNKIYNGADDNASGSAMLLQLARLFNANKDKLNRNIILVWFDAEESGLIGSRAFAKDSAYADKVEKIKLMINLDMVGWYKNGALKIAGVKMLKGWEEIFKQTEKQINIDVSNFEKSVLTDSDHSSFASEEIPAITMTTGTKSPYHKPEDDADKIDYDGMNQICDFVYQLTINASNYADLGFSGEIAYKHRKTARKFEAGIMISKGRANQFYHSGMMTGKQGTAFNGGLKFRYYNRGLSSFELGILAEYERTKQYEGEFEGIKLSIPFNYTFGYFVAMGGGGINFGIAYDYIFDAKLAGAKLSTSDYNPHDVSFLWGFTLRIHKLAFNIGSKYGFLDRYNQNEKITYRGTYFGLSYYF